MYKNMLLVNTNLQHLEEKRTLENRNGMRQKSLHLLRKIKTSFTKIGNAQKTSKH